MEKMGQITVKSNNKSLNLHNAEIILCLQAWWSPISKPQENRHVPSSEFLINTN